ncbi:MAG: FAD-binding oxidoreductase, partial [Pirellulaceae bacterium]
RVTATIFSHAAHGQLHIRPFLDLANPADMTKMQNLAEQLYERVLEFQGTIAGEHALGLSRSWYARRQLGSLYPIMRRIKELFDPTGILNPGKVVSDAPQRVTDNLRPWTSEHRSAAATPVDQPKQPTAENSPIVRSDPGEEDVIQRTTPHKN